MLRRLDYHSVFLDKLGLEAPLENIDGVVLGGQVVLVVVSAVELLATQVTLQVVVPLTLLAVPEEVALVQEHLVARPAGVGRPFSGGDSAGSKDSRGLLDSSRVGASGRQHTVHA